MRFATIGTNFITDWFMEGAGLCKGFELAAVYSRSEDKGKAFAKKYSCETVYTDFTQLVSDKSIEAVYIASPNSLHFEQCEILLNAKKNILCEKPVCVNIGQYTKLLEIAKRNDVLLLEAMRTVFSKNLQCLQAAINQVGAVRGAYFTFSKYSTRYDTFLAGEPCNTFNPEFMGGALLDLGCYTITLAVLLFGAPKAVTATASKLENGLDGAGTVLMQYDNFTVIHNFSKIFDTQNISEINGELGTVRIERASTVEEIYLEQRGQGSKRIDEPLAQTDMVYEIEEFMRLCKDKPSAQRYIEISKTVLNIMDEARAQCKIVFWADNNVY